MKQSNPETKDIMHSTNAAASILGVGSDYVRLLIRSSKLSAHKRANKFFISQSAIDLYLTPTPYCVPKHKK
jgi:excisionase family DNA binding protein